MTSRSFSYIECSEELQTVKKSARDLYQEYFLEKSMIIIQESCEKVHCIPLRSGLDDYLRQYIRSEQSKTIS